MQLGTYLTHFRKTNGISKSTKRFQNIHIFYRLPPTRAMSLTELKNNVLPFGLNTLNTLNTH